MKKIYITKTVSAQNQLDVSILKINGSTPLADRIKIYNDFNENISNEISITNAIIIGGGVRYLKNGKDIDVIFNDEIDDSERELIVSRMNIQDYIPILKHTLEGLGVLESEITKEIVIFSNEEDLPEVRYEAVMTGTNRKVNAERIVHCVNHHDKLIETLEEIAEGKGAYNEDELMHASNTVENMKELAIEALKNAKQK